MNCTAVPRHDFTRYVEPKPKVNPAFQVRVLNGRPHQGIEDSRQRVYANGSPLIADREQNFIGLSLQSNADVRRWKQLTDGPVGRNTAPDYYCSTSNRQCRCNR